MRWSVTQGDILNLPADVLVCSANVYLNLSGGVGGEILRRHGDGMRKELHRYLAERNLHFARPGTVVPTSSCGTPFKAVLHAVAVDALYQSSPSLVGDAVVKSLALAAAVGAKRVAPDGTGYRVRSVADAGVRQWHCPPPEAGVPAG